MSELERALAFMRDIDERRARRVVRGRFGHAHFDDDLPDVWYLNELIVAAGMSPPVEELVLEADRVQSELRHRKVVVDDEALGERLAPELHARGWNVERLVVMAHTGPGRAVDTSPVTEISAGELEPLLYEEHRRDSRSDDEARQLVEARERTRNAVAVRSFAVLVRGQPVASCELYGDGAVAQVENVGTLAEHRGLGYASALVTKAVDVARSAGAELVFLLADEDDWPKELYAKLGFRTIGRGFRFIKAQSLDEARLRAIRVRTRRLELRLATQDEVEALFEVAAAGIHPPQEMPFLIPWTDTLTRERFHEHYRDQLAQWTPDDWSLGLIVFREGRPIGNQSVSAERFAERRTVVTGSWLGMPFQGEGYGTEMRAAVLELAFRGLGAEAAESGALEGNVASARISQKLGYEVVGTKEVAPRGEPVIDTEFRVTRERWRCPIEVEIEGLEPALPLFGASAAATSVRSR